MTLKRDEKGSLVHYPKRANFFEFDKEVAEVFDNMAERSIPRYVESHKINAWIARQFIDKQLREGLDLDLCDVGASTGGFIEALYMEYWQSFHMPLPGVSLYATDTSEHMLCKINEKLPLVRTYEQDVCTMASMGNMFDIVNVSYVLQFLKPPKAVTALREIRQSMNKNGLLFVSQKEQIDTGFADMFQDRYIDFRRQNGYSEDEIQAKTKALKGSMFPYSSRMLVEMLESAGFGQIQETSRWLQFSSVVAIAV